LQSIIHFERVLAPAVRNADIALFLPANVFLTEARAVAVKRLGMSFAGIRSLGLVLRSGRGYSSIRLSGFLTVCSR
jgi:hypothetical protein